MSQKNDKKMEIPGFHSWDLIKALPTITISHISSPQHVKKGPDKRLISMTRIDIMTVYGKTNAFGCGSGCRVGKIHVGP